MWSLCRILLLSGDCFAKSLKSFNIVSIVALYISILIILTLTSLTGAVSFSFFPLKRTTITELILQAQEAVFHQRSFFDEL